MSLSRLSSLSALSALVLLSACNDRGRDRGPTGDTSIMVGDGGPLSDAGPTDGAPGDSPTTDSDPGGDTSLPPGTCNLDVKLAGLPTDPLCDDVWSEAGATLSFVNTTVDDCSAGRCEYMTDPATEQVWLYPGRLEVRLQSAGCSGSSIEVDVNDFCGAGCTKAFAYSLGVEVARAENTSSGPETLLLTPTAPVDVIAVSSCEGLVTEIRVR